MAKIETPAAVREAEELPPSEVRPRTFGQTLIHTLYSAPILGGLALAVAGVGVAGYFYFTRGYNQPPREPAPISTPYNGNPIIIPPVATPTATGTPTPSPTPMATPVAKSFELVCDECSDEESKLYQKIAEDDYNVVKEVYGIRDGRMVVSVSKRGGVGFDFYLEGKRGSSGGDLSDMTPDPTDRGNKHEIGHAINNTLFPTYHSWFDEGLAMYASGEIDETIERARKEGRIEELYSKIEKLVSNPEAYWNERVVGVWSHAVGWEWYRTLILKENLTKEKNRTALSLLVGREPSRVDIQEAFEIGLGVKRGHLSYLFDAIRPAIMKYVSDERVRREFDIRTTETY